MATVVSLQHQDFASALTVTGCSAVHVNWALWCPCSTRHGACAPTITGCIAVAASIPSSRLLAVQAAMALVGSPQRQARVTVILLNLASIIERADEQVRHRSALEEGLDMPASGPAALGLLW